MDEVGAHIQQQSSVASESNSEEHAKIESTSLPLDKRICLVGAVVQDTTICAIAQTFGVPVVTSKTGEEYSNDHSCSTVFVLDKFEGDNYDLLYKSRHPLLGPPALQQLANKNEKLPNNTRPLYNLAMSGVVVCFTGFRNKDDLTKLVPLVHHMGGSIRKDMSAKVTHLIANAAGGEKYQYAATFKVPIMHLEWVLASWRYKDDVLFSASMDSCISEHRLKPFYGTKVCFVGFPEDEERHMTEVLEANGGTLTNSDDPICTHVVMDQTENYALEANSASLSPKNSATSLISPSSSCCNINGIMKPSPRNGNPSKSIAMTTPYTKVNLNIAQLETVHEKSNDNCFNDLNDTFSDATDNLQKLDLDKSGSSKRKRKISPDKYSNSSKRRKDLSYSENRKRKISDFFKTPIGYFSHRRRTIGGSGVNQSLNESVISSSGIFDVQTVENLSRIDGTPNKSVQKNKKIRKNLFLRTFSSSKFKYSGGSKKSDLNSTKSSFGDASELEGGEKMNVTCFPDFSLNPLLESETQIHRNRRDLQGQALTNIVVVDESTVGEKIDGPSKAHIIKAEWFWTSVQKGVCLDEKDYLFGDYIDHLLSPNARRDSHQATPGSASRRKRKRLHDALSSLAHQPSPVSGSFLDCTPSPVKPSDICEPVIADTPRKGLTPRQQVFLELVQTESNYVNILNIIMTMFKQQLENSTEEEFLLNNTELKMIFGNLPPIYETHLKMLEELRWTSANWSEDKSIGNIILKYSTDLLKAYPPFINFFEEMKSVLLQCDSTKPRFHAFLKACQTKPECGRQSLQELLIRPVQRLPSISLLLNDILKHTGKTNADNAALERALASIREVMTHINEDKRKTEGQRVMFDIFNEIDNCPPDLVSSHRNFIAKSEVIQLSASEGLSSKGNPLVMFLFSDQLEVCKKRSKAFNAMKSPNTANGIHKNSSIKPYKHVKLMSLSAIKRVIDIKETDDCQRVFSIVFRNNDELKERLCSFAMTDEEMDKTVFLKTLCKQMATNACTADADKFLAYLEPHQLDIDTSDVSNGTFSKAFKFATKTRLRVGRAFSFNKTPSKLKRAVSSMMSPFGSSTNLTPASQLAQMRLASYNNISELANADNANESPPHAPMSVQPTRKLKTSSLGVNALKRL